MCVSVIVSVIVSVGVCWISAVSVCPYSINFIANRERAFATVAPKSDNKSWRHKIGDEEN